MFDYSPKLPELIFYPFFAGLVAFGIARNFPSDEAMVFMWAIEINCAIVPAFYLFRDGAKYLDSMGAGSPSPKSHTPNLLQDEQPTQADYVNLPRIKSDGKPVYGQVAPRLRIDCIGKFNKTLIDQRNGNLEVNMTEGFWLKRSEGMEENRWARIGGNGPTEFRSMLERGEKYGAYRRAGGQGKWIPAGWDKIRRLANGEQLPQ